MKFCWHTSLFLFQIDDCNNKTQKHYDYFTNLQNVTPLHGLIILNDTNRSQYLVPFRKLGPMEMAVRQNQQLLIALRKRQAQSKNKSASTNLVNISLSALITVTNISTDYHKLQFTWIHHAQKWAVVIAKMLSAESMLWGPNFYHRVAKPLFWWNIGHVFVFSF